jgi:serine/threonine protein kinase
MNIFKHESKFPCSYGKYELLARIGMGGMAEIFRARAPGAAGFEKILVIKRLLPHLADDPDSVQMFVNEAKLAAQVHHRNVVQVFELGQLPDGEYFMAMEHIAGTDLRQILRAAATSSMRVPPWFSVHAMCEVLDGLACAHALCDDQGRPRNVVHRDVTPANIFISYLGDIKLGDFGVAKDDSFKENKKKGELKGKVPYMSPEQLYGRDLDSRSDVFAAGVVLWECLTQRRLFGGRSDIEAMNLICYGERKAPSAFATDVPPELDAVVLHALETNPDNRTPNAEQFHKELTEVLPRLRTRVLSNDVKNIVEVLLGNKDPSATTGPRLSPEVSTAPLNFFEPTPRPERTPLPVAEKAPEQHPYPRMPPPLPPRRETPQPRRETPQPRHHTPSMRPSTSQSGFSTPRVQTSHLVEQLPVQRISAAFASVSTRDERMVTDDYPRDLLQNYSGPHKFYLELHDGSRTGALHYVEAMAKLRAESECGGIARAAISANNQRYMKAPAFAVLTGQEILVDPHANREKELPKSPLTGRLERVSATALLGRLARDRVTGRLVAINGASRREVMLVQGLPTFVYASTDELQIPELLVEKKIVSQEQIPEILHAVASDGRPIEEVVKERTGVDLSRYYATFMKERMIDLFRWPGGAFAVDLASPISHAVPFTPSIYQMLPELLMRARSEDDLFEALVPWMDIRLERTENFQRAVQEMNLSETQMQSVIPFGGRSLASSLKSAREERLALALAYMFLQCELLKSVV